ncbi:hypothetical protein LshimejAT787_1900400 [Lyophyllum shimeji]|uniref:Uncharacterized protein n=1 Tax=Lyophyllum shimeji TaxID=47721 RepID=A0A9P3PXQ1_LYOSH|nr:hypothetical protein LshimejAT787_1900400 [Lyophyllum shimeji]
MASFLLRVFCCLGKRPRDRTIPDDRTRLIPASTVDGETLTGDAPGANARAAFDHVIFKERLGSIVRSKEGKMVNVTSPLPFNLHNKPRALIDIMTHGQGSYMSSSSRSASASTFHESQSPHHERHPHPHHRPPPPPPPRVSSGLRITPSIQPRTPARAHTPARLRRPMMRRRRNAEMGRSNLEEGRSKMLSSRRVSLGCACGNNSLRSGDAAEAGSPRSTEGGWKDAVEAEADGAETTADCERLLTPVNGLPPESEEAPPPSPSPPPRLSVSPASDTFEVRLHDVGALSASWGE